jgi:site-specific recombinase XerD
MNNENIPVRDYRDANKELLAAFDRYIQSRGSTLETRRAYGRPLAKLMEAIGAQNIAEVERVQIRELFMEWEVKGLHPNSTRLYTGAFRAFYRFLNLSGVTGRIPCGWWLTARSLLACPLC